MTESVASNVTGYVETVKVEAEAISTRIQSGIDEAQREIAVSAESFVTNAQKINPLPAGASAAAVDSVDAMFQDLKSQVVDLSHFFSAEPYVDFAWWVLC